ncbi:Uncharacterised protein [Staphylococcus haemolyticus]|nr:Uncharacterised protein [Staphylococcus haemolyticus]
MLKLYYKINFATEPLSIYIIVFKIKPGHERPGFIFHCVNIKFIYYFSSLFLFLRRLPIKNNPPSVANSEPNNVPLFGTSLPVSGNSLLFDLSVLSL